MNKLINKILGILVVLLCIANLIYGILNQNISAVLGWFLAAMYSALFYITNRR